MTLLFFATKGNYPIFDRFAFAALCAINEGAKPDRNRPLVDYVKMSTANNVSGAAEIYEKYMKLLLDKKLFDWNNKNATEKRDIDRALWVYGHLFNAPN